MSYQPDERRALDGATQVLLAATRRRGCSSYSRQSDRRGLHRVRCSPGSDRHGSRRGLALPTGPGVAVQHGRGVSGVADPWTIIFGLFVYSWVLR